LLGIYAFCRPFSKYVSFEERKKTVKPFLALNGFYTIKHIEINSICRASGQTFRYITFSKPKKKVMEVNFCNCKETISPVMHYIDGFKFKFSCSKIAVQTCVNNITQCVYCQTKDKKHEDFCIFNGYESYLKSTCSSCDNRTHHSQSCIFKNQKSHESLLPKCIICLEGYASVCTTSCRHVLTCPNCIMKLNHCPTCRKSIDFVNPIKV